MVEQFDDGQKKFRILILVDAMSSGGMERQISEMLCGMNSQNTFLIYLGVLSAGGARLVEAEIYAHKVVSFTQSKNASWGLVYRLPYLLIEVFRVIISQKISIIHTFGCFSDCLGLISGKLAGSLVINGSIRSARPTLTLRDRISRICMNMSDINVSNSKAGLIAFRLNTIDGKNLVIYNGVALNRFEIIEKHTKNCYFSICMVANFTRKKDHASLVKILPELKKRIPFLRVSLVGRGELLQSIKHQILSLQLDDTVEIISNTDHPEPIIASADVCLLLTNTSVHGEGISNSILEYMALEKPVIATASGGNSEVVVHGHTGYLVPGNDSKLLLERIFEMYTNPEIGKNMGKAGRKKLEQEFQSEIMIHNYLNLYRYLVRKTKDNISYDGKII